MENINYKEECLKVFPGLAIKKVTNWEKNINPFYIYDASLAENQIKYHFKRAVAVGKTRDEAWKNCYKDIEAGRELGSVICNVCYGQGEIKYGDIINVLSVKEDNTIVCDGGKSYHYYRRDFAPNNEANREVLKKISENEEKEREINEEIEKIYDSLNQRALILGYGTKGYLVVDENGNIEGEDPKGTECMKRLLEHMPIITDTAENRAKMELIKVKSDESHEVEIERNVLYSSIERFKNS